MFRKKLEDILTKPKELPIGKDDKFVDPAFVAICVIFLQNLISAQNLDVYQLAALIMFSIAIPMLAIHLFIIQTLNPPNLLLPAFVAISYKYIYLLGVLCTCVGILFMIFRVSDIAAYVFLTSGIIGITLLSFIRIKRLAVKRKQNPQ